MKIRQRHTSNWFINILLAVMTAAGIALAATHSKAADGADNDSTQSSYRNYSYGYVPDETVSFDRLLSLYRQGRQDSYICNSLKLCGNTLYLNGKYAKALEAYTMALKLAMKTDNRRNIIVCNYCIGNTYVIFKDYERAAHYYELVLSQRGKADCDNTFSLAAVYLVRCYFRMGNLAKAEHYLAIQRRHPVSDHLIARYYDLHNAATIEAMKGNSAKALDMQRQAFDVTQRHSLRVGMGADAMNEIARINMTTGHNREAIDSYRLASALALRDKSLDLLDDTYLALNKLYQRSHRADSAAFFLSLHQQLIDTTLNRSEFYAARNKLVDYEDVLAKEEIGKLEMHQKILIAGIIVFVIVLLIVGYYSHKLHSAYRMLTTKNQQLIRQQDENQKLKTVAAANVTPQQVTEDPADSKRVALRERILSVMADIHVVSDPDFSLQTLAQLTASNTKYVSEAISSTPQGSFKALLNDYRIREACKRLNDKAFDAYTIQAVAESVGYVSVNNFIVQFKRFTGMTPSIYRKMTHRQTSVPIFQEKTEG